MSRQIGHWLRLVVLLGYAGLAGAKEPVGLDALDLRYLPQLRTGVAHLASSTDPTGGNNDRGHFLRREGSDAILMEAEGPGMITRIWSANPHGRLRIYFDGEADPRVSMPFARLADETIETPTVAGYVSTAGGGVTCWYPMPFAKGAKVVVTGAEQLYYQVNYTTFPADTDVTTFSPGDDQPPSGIEYGEPRHQAVTVPPGGGVTIFDLTGPATIRRLVLDVAEQETTSFDALRQLRLTVTWDACPGPSIDAPLLDFLACGLGPAQYLSALAAAGDWDFFTVDFPMPFLNRAVGRLTNSGNQAVPVSVTSYVTSGRRDDDGYFHAAYHAAETVAGKPHSVANISGRGHYVGTAVALLGVGGPTYLEGDEQITVDGERKLLGTGTEDYFNGAWFYRRGPFADPFAGAPMLVCNLGSTTSYRWHVSDCIPFERSLQVDLEHGGTNDTPGCTYRSVGYWYGEKPQPVAASTTPARPPVCATRAEAGELYEAEDLAEQFLAANVNLLVLDDSEAMLPASGGRLARLTFAGGDAEATVTIPLTVRQAGLYDVVLRVVSGGPTASFNVAGDVDGEAIPPSRQQPLLGEPRLLLGRVRLAAGDRRLTLTAVGYPGEERPPGMLGLDYIALEPVAKIRGAEEAELLNHTLSNPESMAVVQTLKDLPDDAIRTENIVGGAVPAEAVWSGGAQLRFTPADPGDRLHLKLPIDDDGDYGLAICLTYGPDYGACEVLLNGRPIYDRDDLIDCRRDWTSIGNRWPLGTHRLKAGEQTITVRAVTHDGRLRPIGVDYLLLTTATRGHEGELLSWRATPTRPVVKERFGAEPRWSGGAYLRIPAGGQLVTATLGLFAPRTGRYQVTLKPALIPTGGTYSVALGGATAEASSAGLGEAEGEAVSFTARLRAGLNELTLSSSEAGPDGSDMAVDVIELEPIGGSTSPLTVVALAFLALFMVRAIRSARSRRR